MYLSRLELHGFKSFAQRTTIDFSSGITVVVGPNGCGKSNIVDAVRWVIGEQRARILRSEKMENVIFNGTSGRRSLGMSEVFLTIENTRGILPTEYSEVTIGRRLFRSGESEYLLNGTQCRLKDISDLFMDTGMGAGAYSVIELKMIEDILSENAQDRRHMFEEAAGISKYKIRRTQTLRKLDGTQVDLNRVRDLVEELDKRVRSLQRQAQKTSRFKTLDERLTHLALTLAYVEFGRLTEEAAGLDDRIKALTDQISGFTAKLASEEANHESLRKDHVGREQIVVTAQTDLANHVEMLRSAEADLRLNEERRDVIKRDLTRAADEEKSAKIRRTSLSELFSRTASGIESAKPEAESASAALEAARLDRDRADTDLNTRREGIRVVLQEERNATEKVLDQRRSIDRLSSRQELLEQDIIENRTQLTAVGGSISELDEKVETLTSDLTKKQAEQQKAQEVLIHARQNLEERTKEAEIAESGVHLLERQLDAAAAEMALLESLLSSYDEFSEPVQFLAESTDWSKSGLHTVADLLGCDEKHRTVLDSALGDYSSCIVVKTEEEAERAITWLRNEEKGRATFLILDRLPKNGSMPSSKSMPEARSLSSLVRTQSTDYEPLIKVLLGSSYLVDDLSPINFSFPTPGRYYTLAGEWFDASGLRHGGSATSGSTPAASRLGRREQLEAGRHTQVDLQKGLVKAEELRKVSKKAIENIPMDSLQSELRNADERVQTAEKEHARTAYEIEILSRRRDEIKERQASLESAHDDVQAQIKTLDSELIEFKASAVSLTEQRQEAEKAFSAIEIQSRASFEAFNKTNIVAVEARNRLDNLIRDRNRTEEDLRLLDQEDTNRVVHVDTLKAQSQEAVSNAEALEKEIGTMKVRRSTLDQAVSDARDVLMETKVAISELEARLRDLRRQREEEMSTESRLSVRRAEIKIRREDLVETIAEDFDIDLGLHVMEVEQDFSEADARKEIHELRSKIRNIGPVNALALDSFDEEKERLEFLIEQLADLELAESTLLETIGEINQTASERFKETFTAIEKNFQRLFAELFGEEATANIILLDPDKPLESTIEILAKPTGKKPCVLAQLSGGEKTLTAIALLFAIYLVKPSPFCILDEVDAPLDDSNVDRFMHLIRSFSETTQFILVTHNKRTMEAADRMYGITMQEKGISKLVGVKFDPEMQLVA